MVPTKPTLIMLPAIPCDARFYGAQQEALGDLVEIVVPILGQPDISEAADAVLAMAPPRFLLAGTAYGGCLAIEIASRAPDRLLGLWLMNCSAGAHPDPADAIGLCESVLGGGLEDLLADWAPIIVDPEADGARRLFLAMARDAGPLRFSNQYRASAGRRDRRSAFAGLDLPILLVWGADDRFVPVETGRALAAAAPAARFVPLPGCRHFPPIERPEAVNREARAFIEAVLRVG